MKATIQRFAEYLIDLASAIALETERLPDDSGILPG